MNEDDFYDEEDESDFYDDPMTLAKNESIDRNMTYKELIDEMLGK